jgi:hypothetical protein
LPQPPLAAKTVMSCPFAIPHPPPLVEGFDTLCH